MAFQLVSLTLAAALTVAAAAGAASAPGVTYRNGVIAAVDPVRRVLSVDLPDGLTVLAAGEGVDVAALRPGDAVLVGVREVNGRPEAVRVRTAVASETSSSALAVLMPETTESLPMGPRRPLYVIPDRPRGASSGEGRAATPAKVPAVLIVEAPEPLLPEAEPEPAAPSRVERLREEGQRDLAAALQTVGTLAANADRAWGRYLAAGCPVIGSDGPRAWLALPAGASAPAGSCTELLDRVNAAARTARDRLRDVEDQARANWVPPGVVRKMLAAHGLEH